jgi:hypothetical protein
MCLLLNCNFGHIHSSFSKVLQATKRIQVGHTWPETRWIDISGLAQDHDQWLVL